MIINIIYFLSCALFPLFVLFSFNFLRHKQQSNKHKTKLPPGDMGFPFIGETMEFFNAQRRNKLYEEFVHPRITKHGKIFKTRIIGSPTVIVNGAEANKFLLSNEFKLVKSSWPSSSVHLMGKDSIMEKDGERHRFLRGVIGTSLGYAGLETLVPKLCNFVKLYLSQNWHGQEEISLYRSTKVLTFSIVFECLLGIKVEPGMIDTFERVLEGVFSPAIKFPGSKFSRAMKARKEIEKMIVKVVREKRKEIEEGRVKREEDTMLMSKLVYGMIQEEITEKEIIDNVVLLVFAAHDTTSFAVAMTFKMLAQHPDCYGKVLQEHINIMRNKGRGESLNVEDIKKMKYTWQVARESMRLFPPIFGSFRKAITDIEYEGFTIPKGWKVLWTTYGTHYNEKYFKDPLTFNPSRFEEGMPQYAFVPFGGGPRLCAGYQLAKLNILILVHYVVTQYDWSLLHLDETVTMDPLPFPSLGMPIRISPKHI
ncbi:taxadiene 5-alpha hydroxylase [Trifolium pratense]|uniref:taxadiene 5-alpha hydroxylase n=1 Tax=Trifolium pratense TaxID=57577 RepID=UPI001E690EA9|nr:taxadiene 5-alpha hydroxylase [Trifolium pratense]